MLLTSVLCRIFRQFPLLRSRVEQVDGAEHLVAGPCPEVPLTVLPPAGHWLDEHHRQLRQVTIDPATEPLWKAALLQEPAGLVTAPAAPSHRAVLYFAFCHSITDGTSNGMILGRVVENLDRLAAGREPDVSSPAPISAPVEELARKESVRLCPGLARAAARTLRVWYSRSRHPFLERFVAPLDPDRPLDSYWNQLVPQALTGDQSERLRVLCRQHGVTLNSALSAAVSLAAARLLAGSDPQPKPVSLPMLWMVNLRRFLPEARGVPMAAATGVHDWVTVSGTNGADFWQLAGQVRDVLSDHLDSRLPLLAERWLTPRSLSLPEKPPPKPSSHSSIVFGINNIGSLDGVFPRTTHVRAAEVHRTYKDHATCNAFGSHCFQTVAGRLFYDLNSVHGRVRSEDARRLSCEVMHVLHEVISGGERGADITAQ